MKPRSASINLAANGRWYWRVFFVNNVNGISGYSITARAAWEHVSDVLTAAATGRVFPDGAFPDLKEDPDA